MSKASVALDAILNSIVAVDKPMPDVVRVALKRDLAKTHAGASTDEYEALFPDGPLEKAELRFVRERETGMLILRTRASEPVHERDLDLTKRGRMGGPAVNPHIPPEGTQAYTCTMSKTRTVTFTFTMQSRLLMHVVFDWIKEPPPPAK